MGSDGRNLERVRRMDFPEKINYQRVESEMMRLDRPSKRGLESMITTENCFFWRCASRRICSTVEDLSYHRLRSFSPSHNLLFDLPAVDTNDITILDPLTSDSNHDLSSQLNPIPLEIFQDFN
jgi:hypothetical protein